MGALGAVVVGTGFGCLTHVRALRNAGFDVAALVGRDPAKTKERAARFDVPAACISLAEALALPGIDAVVVATPPHSHASIALESIAAGKHVMCEKPFARDAAEARTMLAAADAAGVVHFLGTEYRFAPGQALLRRVVRDGTIGEPRMATFLFHMPLLAAPDAGVPDWWSDAGQGGGWLGGYASHVVDQVRSMLGDFEGLSAALPLVAPKTGWTVEDSFVAHFRTRDGVEGTLQSSTGDWGPPIFATRVIGSEGTAWAEGDAVKVADAGGTRDIAMPDDLNVLPPDPPPIDFMHTTYDWLHSTGTDMGPYTRLYEYFRDRIQGQPVPDDPPAATFADGVAGMEVMDAIRQSARDHTWVSLV